MEMDQKTKSPVATYYLQWGWNPGTSADPVMHAPVWANSSFASKSETFRSSFSHTLLIPGLRGFSYSNRLVIFLDLFWHKVLWSWTIEHEKLRLWFFIDPQLSRRIFDPGPSISCCLILQVFVSVLKVSLKCNSQSRIQGGGPRGPSPPPPWLRTTFLAPLWFNIQFFLNFFGLALLGIFSHHL